jgi:hypothetical protein
MHGTLMRHADALDGCSEGSEELFRNGMQVGNGAFAVRVEDRLCVVHKPEHST